MSGLRDALRRIGGPSAVSWPSFWVVAVVALIVQAADAIGAFEPRQLPARVAVYLAGMSAMFAVLLVLRRLLLRDVDATPRPWRTIGVFAVAALVRGATIALLLHLLVGIPGNLPYRLVASVLILVPVLMVTALIVDRARSRAALRGELEGAADRLRAASSGADSEIQRTHATIVESIRRTLLAAVDESVGAAPDEVVARLRREVDEGIRPLSHRLSATVPTWSPASLADAPGDVAWRHLWRDVTLGEPYRPLVIGPVAAGMVLAAAVTRFGIVTGLTYSALLGIALFVTFTACRLLVAPRLRRMSSAAARTAIFAVTVVLASGAAALVVVLAVDPNPGLAVAIAVVTPMIALLIAVAQAVDANLREVEAELEATTIALDHASARVLQVAWQRQRVLALAIHGPLQAKVSAAALRLEQQIAAGTATEAAVDEALGSVLEALDQIDLGGGQAGDVRADLNEVAEAWEGVCAISVEVDERLASRIDRDPACARVIVDVFTEACSNAVRHARARAVDLWIDEDESDLIRLTVRDDGRAGEERERGLGSRLLDEVALRWDRQSDAGGTELSVLLPAPPGDPVTEGLAVSKGVRTYARPTTTPAGSGRNA